MKMKRTEIVITTLCALLALLAGGFLFSYYNNPGRLLLKRLERLAEVSSMESSNPLSALMEAMSFQGFFADPVSIDTEYGVIVGTHDQEDMKNVFLYSREAAKSLKLEFANPIVLDIGDTQATCRTNAKLTIDFKDSPLETHAQMLFFRWIKEDGTWKIQDISPFGQ